MDIILEIVDGPQAGESFEISSSEYLNWRGDKIELGSDPKKDSSCSIQKTPQGIYILETKSDRISLEINSAQVKKIHLLPGVSFTLNGVLLRAKTLKPSFGLGVLVEAEPKEKKKGPVKEVQETPKVSNKKSWKSLLQKYFQDFRIENTPAEDLAVFNPPLELEFVRGLLAEKKFTLFFGPRQAGFGHLDLDIKDPTAPELAFEIYPSAHGAEIVNKAGNKVLLNQEHFDRQILKNGDLIAMGPSVIQVRTLDEME